MNQPVYGYNVGMDLLRPGQQFGPYQIEQFLGSGAVAVVYSANTQDGSSVALKVLNPAAASQPRLRRILRNEYQILAKLRHPGVIQVSDAGQIDSHPYIAMAVMEGQTLEAFLRQHEKLGETPSIAIAAQVANTLDYLHRQNIVHRDIKPSNLFLTRNRRVILFDFGTAYDPQMSIPSDEGDGVYGTPAFLSPEQIRRDSALDGRADLYALGIILYRMIAGRKPFYGSRSEVLEAHLYQPPPAPSNFAYVSTAVEEIILTSIAKDANHRFQTGAEFSEALTNAHVEEPPQPLPLSKRIINWFQRDSSSMSG